MALVDSSVGLGALQGALGLVAQGGSVREIVWACAGGVCREARS